jgi:hypothetical protein
LRGRGFRFLWLTGRYFAGFVSQLTVLTPYLPQYVPARPEEKMTQVFVSAFSPNNTSKVEICPKLTELLFQNTGNMTSPYLWRGGSAGRQPARSPVITQAIDGFTKDLVMICKLKQLILI